jgi:DedD protein
MGLLSIFQRNKQTAAKPAMQGRGGKPPVRQAPLGNGANSSRPADTAEAVREARARARRRLMGATVLLLLGVIGFPLLFETQPRPIPVDLPIEIPPRNGAGTADASTAMAAHGTHKGASTATALASPVALVPASGPVPESVSYDARPAASVPAVEPASTGQGAKRSAFATLAAALTSSASRSSDAAASSAVVAPTPGAATAQAKPASKPAKGVAASAPAPAPSKPGPAAHPVPPPVAAAPTSPAAILAGVAADAKPSDAVPGPARYVVQVGAFADDAKVREVRSKVEKTGLKTFIQAVETPAGKRVRVRVGPQATKADADKVAARIKAEGLPAAVLVL